MACRLHVTRDERLTDYHFGPGHPLAPVRVELTMRLAHEFGLRARHGVTVGRPGPGRRCGAGACARPRVYRGGADGQRLGRGPWCPRLGRDPPAPRADVRAGHRGQPGVPRHAPGLGAGGRGDPGRGPCGLARPGPAIAGGMHHAMAAHASGFGVCNDAAVAIAWLLARGAERVAYVDIDAHHGDGCRPPSMTIRGC